MKKYALPLLMLIIAIAGDLNAQDKPLSPKETAEGTVSGVKTTIVYCRPSARGRKMIGGQNPYGEVWRTGANAATTIEFDKNVTVEGKPLKKGKYALFTIPGEKEWVVIFNKGYENAWGAYDYKQNDDVLRVNVKAEKAKSHVETFTITPEKDKVSLAWENVYVPFKIKPQ